MEDKTKQNFVLITGASRGIGKQLAIKSAKERMNLVLVARSEQDLKKLSDKLEKEYKIKAYYYPIDLTNEEFAQELYDWCLEKNISINVLMNNAGFGLFGNFEDLDLKKQLAMIDLNIKAVVELTHTFLPMIKNHKRGYILNVSSLIGLFPLAYGSIYSATKSFINSFSESLRYELKDSSVNVSYLCPGPTKTNFFKDSNLDEDEKNSMDPKVVAEIAVDKLLANKKKILPKWVKYLAKIPNFLLKIIVPKQIKKDISSFDNKNDLDL